MVNLFFIYFFGLVYVFTQKPVSKLNIATGVNFLKKLFIRLSLCFAHKAGGKINPPDEINPPGVFICLRLGFRQIAGFKTKPRRRNNISGRHISLSAFMFYQKTSFKTKTLRLGKLLGGLFLCLSLRFIEKADLKLNLAE